MIKMHTFADELRRKFKGYCAPQDIINTLDDALSHALEAHAFDFGEFNYKDFFDLKRDAITCWNEGLLDFPFDNVIFQHSFQECYRGKNWVGLSIYHITKNDAVILGDEIMKYCGLSPGDDLLMINEYRLSDKVSEYGVKESAYVEPLITVFLYRNPGCDKYAIVTTPTPWCHPDFRGRVLEICQDKYRDPISGMSEPISICEPPIAMAMFLNTKGIRSELINAPESLNKKRIAKGKSPIPAYHVVKIDMKDSSGRSIGGTHASPRPHYRRGHIRLLPNENRTWVQACLVAPARGDTIKCCRL